MLLDRRLYQTLVAVKVFEGFTGVALLQKDRQLVAPFGPYGNLPAGEILYRVPA
jgi:hypothetical protein